MRARMLTLATSAVLLSAFLGGNHWWGPIH